MILKLTDAIMQLTSTVSSFQRTSSDCSVGYSYSYNTVNSYARLELLHEGRYLVTECLIVLFPGNL